MAYLHKFSLLWILIAVFSSVCSQVPDNETGEISLPIYMTAEEYNMIDAHRQLQLTTSNALTTPPSMPVRTMAEWEEIDALFITWTSFTSILRDIVKNAQTECKVVIICADSNAVKSNLTSNNIPLTNVEYLQKPYNTIWMRDYGGNTVYTNDVEDRLFVDWIYNRPRPKDDTIPAAIARKYNIPFYTTTTPPWDLVHTGGNFMSDGRGTAFSSNLVLTENQGAGFSPTPKTSLQIDTIMHAFMGIDYGRYIKMDVLPFDGIHHIDMHMKLLDEETLLVGEYPTGVADGPQIEANLLYVLSNYQSVFGTPYKVVRIQMPPDGNVYPNTTGDYLTYTNNVFVNKTVLVPTYNPQYDSTALRILRENLPGYKVVGIPCNSIIQQSGALHCITHSLGVSDPLLISHQPLEDQIHWVQPAFYTINALIQHKSGIQNATVYYRYDSLSSFQSVPMSVLTSGQNMWTANLPSPQVTISGYCQYYIDANAVSGKHQVRPITAPTGFWTFDIGYAVNIATPSTICEMQPIFPNPAAAITCVPVSMTKPEKGSVCMYNPLGQKVFTLFEGEIPAGKTHYFFDARKFPSGMYLISVETPSASATQRVIIK